MADYSEIHSEVRYYVPLDQSYEVWNLAVTNQSDRVRKLTITGYAEFTNNSNYEQDQVNLQYSQFITSTVFETNRIRHIIHGNLDWVKEGEEVDNKLAISRFFALTGAPVDSYCGDKESFLGRYHGYHNPVGVENGKLSGEMCYNENGCGALAAQMLLKPGETKTVTLKLKGSDLAFVGYDGKWRLEKGDFKIKCGDQWMDIVCDQTKVWNTPNKNTAHK